MFWPNCPSSGLLFATMHMFDFYAFLEIKFTLVPVQGSHGHVAEFDSLCLVVSHHVALRRGQNCM
jgi:hypothetical protein